MISPLRNVYCYACGFLLLTHTKHLHACSHTHEHSTCIHAYTCTNSHTHAYSHMHTQSCMCTSTHTCTHRYTHMNTMHIHIYAHAHIHTHPCHLLPLFTFININFPFWESNPSSQWSSLAVLAFPGMSGVLGYRTSSAYWDIPKATAHSMVCRLLKVTLKSLLKSL